VRSDVRLCETSSRWTKRCGRRIDGRDVNAVLGSRSIMTNQLRTLKPRVGLANLQTAAAPAKTADKFYSSLEWIALRDRVRREAGGRCQAPGCGRIEPRMYVDHRVELNDGGAPLDRRNVWLLCGRCHTTKTVAERVRRTAERPGGGRRCRSARGVSSRSGPHAGTFFPAAIAHSGRNRGVCRRRRH
jgi:5-methylcytosine-specific restriction protein A